MVSQNTLLGHLLGEEAMMSPFTMLGRGLGGLPLMGPLEGRIEDTFRLVPNLLVAIKPFVSSLINTCLVYTVCVVDRRIVMHAP